MELLDEYYCPMCANSLIRKEINDKKHLLTCSSKWCYYIAPIGSNTQFERMLEKLKSFKFKRTYKQHID